MKVASKIKKVTVYKDRALIERVTKVQLENGEHTLIFEGLPFFLDTNSIQISGGNNCILQEIKTLDIYLDEIPNEQKKELFHQIEELEYQIEEIKDKANNLHEEKALLQRMTSFSVESPKKGIIHLLEPDKVKEILGFYGEKLNLLDEAIRANRKEMKKLEEQLNRLKEQQKGYGKAGSKSEKHIAVKLFVQEEGQTEIKLSYVVMSAGWKPIYDFRLNSDEKKLKISYNAIVKQHTGEKWDEVELNLSTAQPQISAVQPELNTWYIDIFHYVPPAPLQKKAYRASKEKMSVDSFGQLSDEMDEMMATPMPMMEAKVETGASAVSFSIPGIHTIIDNNDEHKIGICLIDLEAELEYNAVPKLTPYAYLTSRSVNKSEFPMLPGDANIFLDNQFVTNSSIKLVAPNQEFATSLGIDEAIQIKHKLINKLSKDEGIFSKKCKIMFEYSMEINNNKKIDCTIKIKDQVPVSQNQEIKVELLEPKYKEDTPNLQKSDAGILEWKHLIKPGEKINFMLKFSVEYPKDIKITGID